MDRVEYEIQEIKINARLINKVIIDPHVKKHKDISDQLILSLAQKLDGTFNLPDGKG